MRVRLGGGDPSLHDRRGALGHGDPRGGGVGFSRRPEEAAIGSHPPLCCDLPLEDGMPLRLEATPVA
jgi:hypothetical protein